MIEKILLIDDEEDFLTVMSDRMQARNMQVSTASSAKEVLAEILNERSLPDAILCMNDDVALAATFALQSLGLEVGRDVAIVGFDGIEETEHCPWPITTVKQPIEEMCVLTFDFLKRQMEDPSVPLQQKILQPTLVIRDSSQG